MAALLDLLTLLLATIGGLCLLFGAMTALVARFERPNQIRHIAPMMREEYRP